MASSSQIATRRTVVATVIVLVVLLLLLGGLALLNYILRQPAAFEGEGQAEEGWIFSIYGFEGDLLRRPTNVAFDDQGNIYVADTGKRRIVVFDEDGGFIGVYGNPGRGPTDLWGPIDVAVASDGRSYVVDKSENKIVIFDATRNPLDSITFPDEPPLSVEVSDDELIVTTGSGVLIGTLDGELLTGYVARGQEPGQFDRPAGVAVGPDGTLYIADSLNYRVQALGSDGQVKWTYGEPIPPEQAIRFSDPSRLFGLPASIAADENGFLYVVDGLNGEVQILEQADGTYVETIGDTGHRDGLFYYPDGIDYHDGRIAIADKFNDRVQVFQVPTATTALDRLLPLAPWLLLPLLLLALIPLLRRRTSIMTPSFADRLAIDPRGEEVAAALKKVAAAPSLAEVHKEDYDVLKWQERKFDEDRVVALMDQHKLSREDAEALEVALHTRGKKVLLSDDMLLNTIAAEYELTAVTFDEVLETLGTDEEPPSDSAPVAEGGESVDATPGAEGEVSS